MPAPSVSSAGDNGRSELGWGAQDENARNRLDIEAVIDDLYASEINASISWIWDGGFYAVLGNPKLAEGSAFPSIAEAVEWL
jgi:hypothetical protein